MTIAKVVTPKQKTALELEAKRSRYLRYAGGMLAVMVAVVVIAAVIWAGYTQDWKFFTEAKTTHIETSGTQIIEATEIYHRTLWDWMGLLIIPVVLAGGVFWLNRAERKNETKLAKQRAETDLHIAEDRLQEEALQSYLDKMTQLLLENDLRKSGTEDEVRAVARTRTLTILRRLNEERKGLVVRFLYESELIQAKSDQQKSAVVNLTLANLRMVYLRGANLSGVNLSHVNLYLAELREIDLSEANLSEADLSRADLSTANLMRINLRWADLRGANLSQADLSWADLREADLTDADLSGALLSRARLSKADLIRVNFRKTILSPADLGGADLSSANLTDAELSGADLSGANLSNADLSQADLIQTNFRGAILTGAILNDARCSNSTIWPDGFDPVAAGAKKVNQQPPNGTSTDESKPA